MKPEKELPNLIEKCPRFSSCDVPKCPLDFSMHGRVRYNDEPVCTMSKKILKKIAGRYLRLLSWIDNLNSQSARRRKNASINQSKTNVLKRTNTYQ